MHALIMAASKSKKRLINTIYLRYKALIYTKRPVVTFVDLVCQVFKWCAAPMIFNGFHVPQND
jgi:predicted nucleotidyltransferase